jgi:hypothetical protein
VTLEFRESNGIRYAVVGSYTIEDREPGYSETHSFKISDSVELRIDVPLLRYAIHSEFVLGEDGDLDVTTTHAECADEESAEAIAHLLHRRKCRKECESIDAAKAKILAGILFDRLGDWGDDNDWCDNEEILERVAIDPEADWGDTERSLKDQLIGILEDLNVIPTAPPVS